jgi:hypothetical protein
LAGWDDSGNIFGVVPLWCRAGKSADIVLNAGRAKSAIKQPQLALGQSHYKPVKERF